MKRLLALLMCLSVVAAPRAVGAADADKRVAALKRAVRKSGSFYELRWGRYVIKTDVDAQFAAEASLYMDRFYRAFRSFFKPRPKLKVTPVVYFFKDRESYQACCRERGFGQTLLKAGGFYRGSRSKSELFCWHKRPGSGFEGFPKEVVRHEGAHQLLSYILGTHRIPIWYNEGVATFFESWNVEQPREANLKRLATGHTRFALIARTFGTKEFVDLHELMRLTHKTWVPDAFGRKTAQHYAEVQSFMTFLLVSEKGRKFFAILFRAIAQGKDPATMLSRKVIDSAQRAWYKDIEDRVEASVKGAAPAKRR